MGEIRVRRHQKESEVALTFWRVLTVKFHTPRFESLLLHVTSWEWRLAETVFSNVNLE